MLVIRMGIGFTLIPTTLPAHSNRERNPADKRHDHADNCFLSHKCAFSWPSSREPTTNYLPKTYERWMKDV